MLKQHLKPGASLFWLITVVALSSLACSLWGGTDGHTIRIRTLPDLTPTTASLTAAEESPAEVEELTVAEESPAEVVVEAPAASAQNSVPAATPLPLFTATAAPTVVAEVQSDTSIQPDTAMPTATAIVIAATEPPPPPPPTSPPANPIPAQPPPEAVTGWSFIGVRMTIDQGNAHIIGEMVNNTGASQTDIQVTSIVYGSDNRVITDQAEMIDYVPIEAVPAGAHIPFEVIVSAQEAIYRVDLTAVSYPAEESPRQDFQFASVNQWIDESLYCLGGQVQNNAQLDEYLIILAVTYNNSGQVVSFGEYAEGDLENIGTGQTAPFEMCIDPSDQNIVHHELKAVGL